MNITDATIEKILDIIADIDNKQNTKEWMHYINLLDKARLSDREKAYRLLSALTDQVKTNKNPFFFNDTETN